MKTRSLIVAIGLLLSFLMMSPVVQATPLNSVNCNSGCSADTGWKGGMFGGNVEFEVTGPTMHFNNSIAAYSKSIQLKTAQNTANPHIEFGEEIQHGNFAGLCGNAGAGNSKAWYYSEAIDHLGNDEGGIWCVAVPSGDVNGFASFQINPDCQPVYSCNPQHWNMIVQTPGLGAYVLEQLSEDDLDFDITAFNCSSCVINYNQFIRDTVSSHAVWGFRGDLSQYANSTYNYNYQTRAVDYNVYSLPPEWTWTTNPAPGNNGGVVVGCVYNDSNLCVAGQ